MAEAFTAGVKPGGLTSDTEIRILLCYLIKSTGPVTRDALQTAILQEQLVNYFEFVNALNELEVQGLATKNEEGYRITDKGMVVANTLAEDLPRSVRESAIRALIRIQGWLHKAAQNRASVRRSENGYTVTCTIGEMGQDVFQLRLTMPDAMTAEVVKNRFIAQGSEIYASLLTTLTKPLSDDKRPPDAML